jgi:hypothetical protein
MNILRDNYVPAPGMLLLFGAKDMNNLPKFWIHYEYCCSKENELKEFHYIKKISNLEYLENEYQKTL